MNKLNFRWLSGLLRQPDISVSTRGKDLSEDPADHLGLAVHSVRSQCWGHPVMFTAMTHLSVLWLTNSLLWIKTFVSLNTVKFKQVSVSFIGSGVILSCEVSVYTIPFYMVRGWACFYMNNYIWLWFSEKDINSISNPIFN